MRNIQRASVVHNRNRRYMVSPVESIAGFHPVLEMDVKAIAEIKELRKEETAMSQMLDFVQRLSSIYCIKWDVAPQVPVGCWWLMNAVSLQSSQIRAVAQFYGEPPRDTCKTYPEARAIMSSWHLLQGLFIKYNGRPPLLKA